MPLVPGQVNSANGFGTSIAIAYPANTTAGNLLICGGCGHSDDTSNTATSQSVLTAVSNNDVTNGIYTTISYVENCTATAVTWTRNHASDDASIAIAEYNGMLSASILDVTLGTAQGFSTAGDSGNIITTVNDELLIGFSGFENTGNPVTATGGFTEDVEVNAPRGAQLASRTVSTTGTYKYTCTYTPTPNWCASIASFKAGVVAKPDFNFRRRETRPAGFRPGLAR